MAFKNVFATADNYQNTPHGGQGHARVGQLKIGRSPVLDNMPFSYQTNSQRRTVAYYPDSQNIPDPAKTGTVILSIVTPSNRLRPGVQIFPVPMGTVNPPGIGAVACRFTLLAVGQDPTFGIRHQSQPVFSGNAPYVSSPTDWPTYRQLDLQIDCDSRNWNWNGLEKGSLCVVVNWEPTVDMSEDELNRLRAYCSVTVPAPLVLT